MFKQHPKQKWLPSNLNKSPKAFFLLLLAIASSTTSIASTTSSIDGADAINTYNSQTDMPKDANNSIQKTSNDEITVAGLSIIDQTQTELVAPIQVAINTTKSGTYSIDTAKEKNTSHNVKSSIKLADKVYYAATRKKPTTEIVLKDNISVKFTNVLIHAPRGTASYKIKTAE